jgi:hypothetical protein
MDECQLKGHFYNFDDKYFPGHKCKEKNLFMEISEDVTKRMLMFPLLTHYPKEMVLLHPLILYKLNS